MEETSHQGAEAGRAEAPARPVCFITLGCAKNEADTAAMERRAVAAGYRLADDPERADALVVNTCSFIQSATEESIEAVLDAAGLPRVASGGTRRVVAGCMPARYGDELAAELPEAAAFVPCSREDDIVAVLDGLFGVERAVGEPPADEGAAARPAGTFGYVKISDGCDRWCSYCAIPLIRGRYHSFPVEQVRADVARLVDAGYRAAVTPVIAVRVPNEPGGLARLLEFCDEAGMNVEYGYCYSVGEDGAIDVLKIEGTDAEEHLAAAGFAVVRAEEIYAA